MAYFKPCANAAAVVLAFSALTQTALAKGILARDITTSPVSVPLQPSLLTPNSYNTLNRALQNYGSSMQPCPNKIASQYVDACLSLQHTSKFVTGDSSEINNLNRQAAINLAWHNFLALNSIADPGSRGIPQTTFQLSESGATPSVWETYHHRIELYGGFQAPGSSVITPNGPIPQNINEAPEYVYGQGMSQYPSCYNSNQPTNTPYHNLDENSQIGFVYISAQPVAGTLIPILFEAKLNNTHWQYVTSNNLEQKVSGQQLPAQANYEQLIQGKPPAVNNAKTLFFPAGSIETKAAWRRLTAAEIQSKHFYMARVRYYKAKPPQGAINPPTSGECFIDSQSPNTKNPTDVWGLVGLHIIMRPYFVDSNGLAQPYPYFIFSTFEQQDNYNLPGKSTIASSAAVNSPDISYPNPPTYNALYPMQLTIPHLIANGICQTKQANPQAPLVMAYLSNGPTVTQGSSSKEQYCAVLNQGKDSVVKLNNPPLVNVLARRHLQNTGQQAITTPSQFAATIKNTVWQYYQLTEVQYQPSNPASNYSQKDAYPTVSSQDASSYYMANGVIETPYSLSNFRGNAIEPSNVISHYYNRISDYPANSGGKLAYNVLTFGQGFQLVTSQIGMPQKDQSQYTGHFNMGGCMGCHGTNQGRGGDFSFLLADGPFAIASTIDAATLTPLQAPNTEAMAALSAAEQAQVKEILMQQQVSINEQRRIDRSLRYNLSLSPLIKSQSTKPKQHSSTEKRIQQWVKGWWSHLKHHS